MTFRQDLQDDLVLRDRDFWVPAFGITICVSFAAAGVFTEMPWLSYLNKTIVLIGLGLYVIMACAIFVSAVFVAGINPKAYDAGEDLQKIMLIEGINHPRLVFNVISTINIVLLHYIGGFPGPVLLGAFVLILLSTKFIKMRSRQILKEKLRAEHT